MSAKTETVVGCDIDKITQKIRQRADDFKNGLDLAEAIVTEAWEPVEGCEVELFLLVEHSDASLTIASFRHNGFAEKDGSSDVETESIFVPPGGPSMTVLKRHFDGIR